MRVGLFPKRPIATIVHTTWIVELCQIVEEGDSSASTHPQPAFRFRNNEAIWTLDRLGHSKQILQNDPHPHKQKLPFNAKTAPAPPRPHITKRRGETRRSLDVDDGRHDGGRE